MSAGNAYEGGHRFESKGAASLCASSIAVGTTSASFMTSPENHSLHLTWQQHRSGAVGTYKKKGANDRRAALHPAQVQSTQIT
jgi:hypothetical protein